jgi:hypothetical protein
VVDSSAQMTRLHELFVNTSPTLYFVPLTMLATLLVWVLLVINKDDEVRPDYRRAGLFALLLTILNLFIVATVVTRLFGTEYLSDADRLRSIAWQWNILNLLRMSLIAITVVFLFNAFRKLDRRTVR